MTDLSSPVYDLGIVVPAVGIDEPTIQRFTDCLLEHENTTAKIRLEIVRGPDQGMAFNAARARNAGIRACLDDCPIIVCADVDYLVPAGLVDYTAFQTGEKHLWALRRNIPAELAPLRSWAHWMSLKIHVATESRPHGTCTGSWNALSAANWRRIGGWDERCTGWGGEDDVLHARIAEAGIETVVTADFPLMHVRHTPREFSHANRRSEANLYFATLRQPNYLKGESEGVTFAILTCQRLELFCRTMKSFLANCLDRHRIVRWIVVDHGSEADDRREILERFNFLDWEMISLPRSMSYTQARQKMIDAPRTRLALLWEDDWETYRAGEIITEAEAVLTMDPAIKCVTFRYWPDPVVRFGGFAYRLHEKISTIGPKGYRNYSDSHWGPFSWNPSLHVVECLRKHPVCDDRPEWTMAAAYEKEGWKMAHTLQGYVRHVGTQSRLKK
jgi:GT2 family glycosyltransferase